MCTVHTWILGIHALEHLSSFSFSTSGCRASSLIMRRLQSLLVYQVLTRQRTMLSSASMRMYVPECIDVMYRKRERESEEIERVPMGRICYDVHTHSYRLKFPFLCHEALLYLTRDTSRLYYVYVFICICIQS